MFGASDLLGDFVLLRLHCFCVGRWRRVGLFNLGVAFRGKRGHKIRIIALIIKRKKKGRKKEIIKEIIKEIKKEKKR